MALTFEPGTHACHLFRGFDEQSDIVLSFFEDGLRLGEHCLYITSNQTIEDWYQILSAHGIDVGGELGKGTLSIINGEDWRQTGDMNSILKAREALAMIEGLLGVFPGVRIAGDAAWALNPFLPADQLCHMEATLNLVYEGWNVRTICQYDLDGQSPSALNAALRTHPYAIFDRRLIENPYYEAPLILAEEPRLNGSDADEQTVSTMLNRLRIMS